MRLAFLNCEARCVFGILGLVRDTGQVRQGLLRRRWEGKAASSTHLRQAKPCRSSATSGSCPVRRELWGEVSSRLRTPGCLQPPTFHQLEAARAPAKAHGHQDGPQHCRPSPSLGQCMSGSPLFPGKGEQRHREASTSSLRAAVPGSGLGWSGLVCPGARAFNNADKALSDQLFIAASALLRAAGREGQRGAALRGGRWAPLACVLSGAGEVTGPFHPAQCRAWRWALQPEKRAYWFLERTSSCLRPPWPLDPRTPDRWPAAHSPRHPRLWSLAPQPSVPRPQPATPGPRPSAPSPWPPAPGRSLEKAELGPAGADAASPCQHGPPSPLTARQGACSTPTVLSQSLRPAGRFPVPHSTGPGRGRAAGTTPEPPELAAAGGTDRTGGGSPAVAGSRRPFLSHVLPHLTNEALGLEK